MAVVYKKENEDIESLLKRFKKQVIADGTLQELKKREFYIAPSLKRRLKSEAAQKRDRKIKHEKYIDRRYDY